MGWDIGWIYEIRINAETRRRGEAQREDQFDLLDFLCETLRPPRLSVLPVPILQKRDN